MRAPIIEERNGTTILFWETGSHLGIILPFFIPHCKIVGDIKGSSNPTESYGL